MRNRVSFSYVNEYLNQYDAYAYTVFLAYSYNDIWRHGIKYTYLSDNVKSFVYHNLGTSYIHQDNNHIINLYEQEYDRQQFILSNDEYENNEKHIENTFVTHKNNKIPYETIYTSVYIDKNSYTYFPSFIEGFSGDDYVSNKIAYSYSTNNMPIEKYNINRNDYGFFSGDDHSVIMNIKDKHGDSKKVIIGIGFDEESISNNMISGFDHGKLICAYVYEASSNLSATNDITRVTNDQDIYNNLTISMPGVEVGWTTGNDANHSWLAIDESFKQIGLVLVKLQFNWHNNIYTLYHQLQFSNVVDKIGNIDDLKYYVNSDNRSKTMLLHGDHIDFAGIKTIPVGGNGKIKMEINNNVLSTAYNGYSYKENHSPADRIYLFNGINCYVANTSGDVVALFSYNYTNDSNNSPAESSCSISTPVEPFVIDNNSIKLKYGPNTFTGVSDEVIEYTDTISCNVSGSFDISPNYRYKLIPNGSYNIVNVSCEYSNGNGNDNTDIISYDMNGLKFANNKNSYQFSFSALENPGIYTFKYHLQNGIVTNGDDVTERLGSLTLKYNTGSDYTINTYEGAFREQLLPNEIYGSYSVFSESLITVHPIDNYDVNVPSYNFNNWRETFAYLDVSNTQYANANIGFVNIKATSSNDNHDGEYNISSTNNIDCVSIKFINNSNNYVSIDKKYNITIRKIKTKLTITQNDLQNGSTLYSNNGLIFNSDDTTYNVIVNKDNEETPYIDISSMTGDANNIIKLSISETFVEPSDANNFSYTWKNIKYSKGIELSEAPDGILFNYDEGYIEINKNDIKINNDETLTVSWDTKLNRQVESFNNEYWDALGFNKAVRTNTLYIYNTQQKIDEIPVPSQLYLYSNVKDKNDSNGPSSYLFNYMTVNPGQTNPEKFKISYNGSNIIDEDGNGKLTINGEDMFSISHYISQDKAIISFTPIYNATGDYTLTLKTDNQQQKDVTVHLKQVTFNYNDEINELHYLTDLDDNILYEEILLSGDYGDDTSSFTNDSTFIYKFCDQINQSSPNNLLDNYEITSKGNIINIIFKVKNANISNVPNGILFNINTTNTTNLIYNNYYKALVPTATSGVNLECIHEYDSDHTINISQSITMTKINDMNQSTKLYTHGQKK